MWFIVATGAMRIPARAASDAADGPRQRRRAIGPSTVQERQRSAVHGGPHVEPGAGAVEQRPQAEAHHHAR